jgi:putative phosphoesterase
MGEEALDRRASARRIGLMSDTHGLLRNEIYAVFEGVDEIFHAGDVGDPAILTELEVLAPVQAVYGNVDGWDLREAVPESIELERVGHKIAIIHGDQWGSPRESDLLERFQGFSVIVYGHTHQPLIEIVGGTLVVNPGSAGHQRFGKPVTAALLTLEVGKPPQARLYDLLR